MWTDAIISSSSQIAVVAKNLIILWEVLLDDLAIKLRATCIEPAFSFGMSVAIHMIYCEKQMVCFPTALAFVAICFVDQFSITLSVDLLESPVPSIVSISILFSIPLRRPSVGQPSRLADRC